MPRSLHVKLDGEVTLTDQFHMQTAEQVRSAWPEGTSPLDPQEGRGLVFAVVVAGAQVLDGGVGGVR